MSIVTPQVWGDGHSNVEDEILIFPPVSRAHDFLRELCCGGEVDQDGTGASGVSGRITAWHFEECCWAWSSSRWKRRNFLHLHSFMNAECKCPWWSSCFLRPKFSIWPLPLYLFIIDIVEHGAGLVVLGYCCACSLVVLFGNPWSIGRPCGIFSRSNACQHIPVCLWHWWTFCIKNCECLHLLWLFCIGLMMVVHALIGKWDFVWRPELHCDLGELVLTRCYDCQTS